MGGFCWCQDSRSSGHNVGPQAAVPHLQGPRQELAVRQPECCCLHGLRQEVNILVLHMLAGC